jgi:hypothetical protein
MGALAGLDGDDLDTIAARLDVVTLFHYLPVWMNTVTVAPPLPLPPTVMLTLPEPRGPGTHPVILPGVVVGFEPFTRTVN